MRPFTALVLGLLASCGSETRDPSTMASGEIVGHVRAAPTCPVVIPDEPGCAPAPVDGVVQLAQDGRVIASAPTDATGRFAVVVPEGSYRMSVDVGGRAYPVCEVRDVRVGAGTVTVADLACDTGIR